jgi:hypothetical protein
MSDAQEVKFECRVCGEHHILPIKYSVKAPMAVIAIPQEEWDARLVITPEQCVIDNKDFYLRGRILVPVVGIETPFVWGVWAEVSPKSFLRTHEMWNTPGRENEPAFPGWLNTELPLFGDTFNLVVNIHTQPVGQRPQFTVADPEHPLAIEQREGITLERVQEIAIKMLHGDDAS